MNRDIMKALGFQEHVENVEHGKCGTCGKPVDEREPRNEISKREFKISGMCQKCQDMIFGED